MMPSKVSGSASPKHSLSERLNRSRRHRQWANSQLDTASLGGASVSSAGNASTSSEPGLAVTPHVTRIRNRVQMALAQSQSTDNGSGSPTKSPPSGSTPSPEKRERERESLAQRRTRALNLQKKKGATPNYTSPTYGNHAAKEAPPMSKSSPPSTASVPPHGVVVTKREGSTPVSVQSSPLAFGPGRNKGPSSRPRSPCESVQYQANAMDLGEGGSAPPTNMSSARPTGVTFNSVASRNISADVPVQSTMLRPSGFRKNNIEEPSLASPSQLRPAPQATGKNFSTPSPNVSSMRPTSLLKTFSSPPPVAQAPNEIKEGFNGAIIETPHSASVASLRASFNNNNSGASKPLMPMNSTDPRIRHSIGLVSKQSPVAEQNHHVHEGSRTPTRPSPNERGALKEPPGRGDPIERGLPGSQQMQNPSPNGPSGSRPQWHNRSREAADASNGVRGPPGQQNSQKSSWQNRPSFQSTAQSAQSPQTISKEQTGAWKALSVSRQDRGMPEAPDAITPSPKNNNSWQANRSPMARDSQQGAVKPQTSWRTSATDPAERPKQPQQSWKNRSSQPPAGQKQLAPHEAPNHSQQPSLKNTPQVSLELKQAKSEDVGSRVSRQSWQQQPSQPDRTIQKQVQPSWQNRSSPSRPHQDRPPSPKLQMSSSWQSPSASGRAAAPMDQRHDWRSKSSVPAPSSNIHPHDEGESREMHSSSDQELPPAPPPPPPVVHNGPANSVGAFNSRQKDAQSQSLVPGIQPMSGSLAEPISSVMYRAKELPQKSLPPTIHALKETGRETFVEQLDEPPEQSHRQLESPQPENAESIGDLQQTAPSMDEDRDEPWIDDGNDSENGELVMPSEEEYYDYDYEPPAQLTTRQQEANMRTQPSGSMPQSQSTKREHTWEKHSADEQDPTRKGDYDEEKKSTEEVLQEGRDQIRDNELVRDQHRSTYLTQMAADSTLIADYEEAIKHGSKKISYDEEDESYISWEGHSSALPRHLPPEFEQVLAKESQPRSIQQLKVETEPAADHEVAQETADDDDTPDDEEEISPTTSRQHPRLPPSPRDNESYRMGYYGESADASTRGQRRKSREKPNISVSLLVESAPQVRESLPGRGDRVQNTAPLRYHDHRAYEQDEYALETSYESQQPPSNARSSHAAPGYLSGSEYSDSAGLSSPDVSTDRTSAYPGSSIDEIDEGRFGGLHPSQYADPITLARNQVRGDSGLVFRNPDTFVAAGIGRGVVSPSVRRRGTAMEHWRGGQDTTKRRAQDEFSSPKSKSSASQILKFWTSGAASEDEQEEAQSFQDTAQWVDRDPDVGGFRDDDDVSPPLSPEPRVLEKNLNVASSRGMPDLGSLKGWRQAPLPLSTQAGTTQRTPDHESRNTTTPSSRAWVGPNTSFATSGSDMKSNKSRSKSKKKRAKEVFDPFADSDDVRIDDASVLFSPLPDPYMTEESFSPPTWDTPRGRTTQPYASSDWSQTQAEI